MAINQDKVSQLKAEALHHHDRCEHHRRGMFDEAYAAGKRFQDIKYEFINSGGTKWKRDWADWQKKLYRDHGISDRKVREYVQIATEYSDPWFVTLRRKGWEPNSIAEFHRMAKRVKQDPVAAMRGQIRDSFEVDVLGNLTENQICFLMDSEDDLFWDFKLRVVQAYGSWMAYTGDFETETQYNAAMTRRERIRAANRARRRTRAKQPEPPALLLIENKRGGG